MRGFVAVLAIFGAFVVGADLAVRINSAAHHSGCATASLISHRHRVVMAGDLPVLA